MRPWPDAHFDAALALHSFQFWAEHPAPIEDAINPWTKAFCSRRDFFTDDEIRDSFQEKLASFLEDLWMTTETEKDGKNLDKEVQNWLKLAAFVIRNREIKI